MCLIFLFSLCVYVVAFLFVEKFGDLVMTNKRLISTQTKDDLFGGKHGPNSPQKKIGLKNSEFLQ